MALPLSPIHLKWYCQLFLSILTIVTLPPLFELFRTIATLHSMQQSYTSEE